MDGSNQHDFISISEDTMVRYEQMYYEVVDSICNQTGIEKFDTTYSSNLGIMASDTLILSFHLQDYSPNWIINIITSNSVENFGLEYNTSHPLNSIWSNSNITYINLPENLTGDVEITWDIIQESFFSEDGYFTFEQIYDVDGNLLQLSDYTTNNDITLDYEFKQSWLPDSVLIDTIYYDDIPTTNEIVNKVKPVLTPTFESGIFETNVPIKTLDVFSVNGQKANFKYTDNIIDFSQNISGVYIIKLNSYSYKIYKD